MYLEPRFGAARERFQWYKMADGRSRRATSKVDFKSLELAEELLFDDATKREKANKADFYEVVLASEEPQMKDGVLKNKVHYVGYSNEFDEWVPISEIINKSPSVDPAAISPVSVNDLSILRFRIKASLTLNRRMDTKITLILPVTPQTWSVLGAIDFRFSYFLTAIGRYGGRGSYP